MKSLSFQNTLFQKLSVNPPEWWINLKTDKELCIQVRKDNSIDVYFNGGALITGLKYNGVTFSGKIHKKYIPLRDKNYVKYSFDHESVEFPAVNVIKIESFSSIAIRKIIDRIKLFYPKTSEKGIQYTFIKKDPFFIDSEFQSRHKGRNIKIDLIRIDEGIKKLVFIEVKTIGDNRIYTDGIREQLKVYCDFITSRKYELLDYYKKVFAIKKELGLLHRSLANLNMTECDVLTKPLLLFGDCRQDWINRNAPYLDEKIKKVAVGCYYFGEPNYLCDIVEKTSKNKHIFYTL